MPTPIPTTSTELHHLLETEPKLQALLRLLETPSDGDPAHDRGHVLRVVLSACQILGKDAVNAVAAALLHDLVNIPKNHPDRALASEKSAEAAWPLLAKAGFSADSTEEIALAIRQHSFSRGEKPSSPLGMALQDADRLEALGAIGLMRVFSTGVRMQARYFHPTDPWAKHRELDDKAFSLDHFFTKLLKLPETMNTQAGRMEARKRVLPLQAFIDSLERELGEKRTE